MAKTKASIACLNIYSVQNNKTIQDFLQNTFLKVMDMVYEEFVKFKKNQQALYKDLDGLKGDLKGAWEYFAEYIESARNYLILGCESNVFDKFPYIRRVVSKSLEEFLEGNSELFENVKNMLLEEQSFVIKCITNKNIDEFEKWQIESRNFLFDVGEYSKKVLARMLKTDIES